MCAGVPWPEESPYSTPEAGVMLSGHGLGM